MKRIALLAAMLVIVAGCTGGLVGLQYTPVNAVSAQCSGVVNVITFKDVRKADALGTDSSGNPVASSGDVADWVSRAVFTELANDGCDVRYHDQAGTFPADADVTGEVLQASVTQTGNTTWKAVVRVRFIVNKDGKRIYSEKGFAEVEKPVLPGVATREALLDEALGSVIGVVLPSVVKHLPKS